MAVPFKLTDFDKEFIKREFSYVFGTMHPEHFHPQTHPLHRAKLETIAFTDEYQASVNLYKKTVEHTDGTTEELGISGTCWFYFSPLADVMKIGRYEGNGVRDSVFSSSNGPYDFVTNKKVTSTQLFGTNASQSHDNIFLGYRALRLLSASFECKLLCPENDISGVISIGIGLRAINEDISIDLTNIRKQFLESRTFNARESTVCRYRPLSDEYLAFAPYESHFLVPYYFFYAENVSPTATFEINIKRHFEGVMINSYADFDFYGRTSKPVADEQQLKNIALKLTHSISNELASKTSTEISIAQRLLPYSKLSKGLEMVQTLEKVLNAKLIPQEGALPLEKTLRATNTLQLLLANKKVIKDLLATYSEKTNPVHAELVELIIAAFSFVSQEEVIVNSEYMAMLQQLIKDM